MAKPQVSTRASHKVSSSYILNRLLENSHTIPPCYLHFSKSPFPLSENKLGKGSEGCHTLPHAVFSYCLFLFSPGTRTWAFCLFSFPCIISSSATEQKQTWLLFCHRLKSISVLQESCEMGPSNPWYLNGGNEVIWTVFCLAHCSLVSWLLQSSILHISSWIWPLHFLYFSSNKFLFPSC